MRPVFINGKLMIGNIYKRNHEGGNSKARNPKMQDMLRMIGFGENLGSGFPKILDAWKEAHWDVPTLEDRLATEEVRLTLPIPFEQKRNVTDNVIGKLTERQRVILNILQLNVTDNVTDNLEVTAESLARKLSVSTRTIKRDLKCMKELGIVEREGADHGGRWIVSSFRKYE